MPYSGLSMMTAVTGDGTSPSPAALDAFTQNVAEPIVQSRCITCHVQGGVAGTTDLIFVNSANADSVALNHQAFINLNTAIADVSDHVVSKVLTSSIMAEDRSTRTAIPRLRIWKTIGIWWKQ